MSGSPAPYGMLLDRGLTLEQLDLAYDIAVADPDPKTNRKKLTIALRDLVSEQEAEGKTKKCLTRVWLNPPPEAAEMIAWASAADVAKDRRVPLHFGALIATFPFAGAVARVLGQHLVTEGSVDSRVVRTEVRRHLGDRPSVEVAARKAYTTFRHIGLIEQVDQVLTATPVEAEAGAMTGWLAHALMLTRGAESLPESSVMSAPEFLGLVFTSGISRSYPLVERHNAAQGITLVQRRPRFADATVERHGDQPSS